MKRSTLGALALVAALRAGYAAAACTPAGNVCSYNDVAFCCGATSCTLDGTITIANNPQQPCVLDFGPRDVTVSGSILMPGASLTLRAASLTLTTGVITGSGQGGNLTLVTTGQETPALALKNPGARIDLSDTQHGGTLTVHADGRIDLTAGSISTIIDGTTASTTGFGGDVLIDTTAGDTTVGSRITTNGGLFGFSGIIQIHTAGNIVVQNSLNSRGGTIDLTAGGTLTMPTASAALLATALAGSGNDGGDVSLTGASLTLQGTITASGDGPDASGGTVDLEAINGPLTLAGTGVTADGDSGEVDLGAQSQSPGADVVITAPISAQGQGNLDSGASGGAVTVTAGGSITVGARIDISGNSDFSSSSLDLDADGDVTVNGPITGNDPGGGAQVSIVTGGSAAINADVLVPAPGLSGNDGGALEVISGDTITIAPRVTLDVSALSSDGGSIEMDAQGTITVGDGATLITDSAATGGSAGDIDLRAGTVCDRGLCRTLSSGDLTLKGKLSARGQATNAGVGATIELSACTVDIAGDADVAALGDAGAAIVALGRTAVRLHSGGRLRATATTEIDLPTGAVFAPEAGTTVSPAPVVNPHAACTPAGTVPECRSNASTDCCLMPCPSCGDHTVDFPEECDGGGTRVCLDASTDCSIHCRRVACDSDGPCTADSCDATRGCIHPLELGPGIPGCDDGDACNGRETCVAIQPTLPECRKGTPPKCDDGNPCTTDCDPAAAPGAECVRTNLSGISCSNNNRCDGIEECQNGVCAAIPGTPIICPQGKVCNTNSTNVPPCEAKPCTLDTECNDGNPCTRDQCVGEFCQSAADNTLSCDDGLCNGADHCVGGICQHDPACVVTDDGHPCTLDFCDPARGCVHDPIAACCETDAECQAVSPCAICNANHACVPDPNCCLTNADCNDQNVCTVDSCAGLGNGAPHGTCQHVNVSDGPLAGCGDACRDGAQCVAGICNLGTPHVCPDDGDPCTLERCDPFDTDGNPCHRDAIANCCHNVGECDDGDTCTEDSCDANQCRNLYTRTGCRECDTGKDSDQQCTSPCSATSPEACILHECQPIQPISCDDHDATTVDTCVVDETGAPTCHHRCTATSCDDHDACTIDACDAASGTCHYTALLHFEAINCHVDPLSALLANASPDDIVASLHQKAAHVLALVGTQLETAQADAAAGRTKPAGKLLKKIGKELGALDAKIKAAAKKRRPQISSALATSVRSQIAGARGALSGALAP